MKSVLLFFVYYPIDLSEVDPQPWLFDNRNIT